VTRLALRPPATTAPATLRSAQAPFAAPHSRVLAMQRAIGNRGTRRVLARAPAGYPVDGWTLLYKDKFGSYEDDAGNLRWRKIQLDDREFHSDYIDFNIRNATVDVDLDTGDWAEMTVYYVDGRTKTFKRAELPTTFYHGQGRRSRGVGAVLLDSFERHDDDEFIYPVYKGTVMLTPYLAPNLTSLRDQAEENSRELVRLRKLAFVTGEFLNIMGLYGIAVGELHSIREMPHGGPSPGRRRNIGVRTPTDAEVSVRGAVPRDEPTSKPTGVGGEPDRPPTSMRLPDERPPSPPPRRQQQQQHQQPGVRLHPPEQEPQQGGQEQERRYGQRQQQQQQQQGQTRDARTRRRQSDRYSEGAEIGLSREGVDALRAEIIGRPKIERPPAAGQDAAPNQLDLSRLAADHRGANSHFDLSDPAKIDIIVSTINEPQAILVSRNGSWTFYKNGTVVVTERGAVNAMRTAYGRGGRIPPRDIARARMVNPAAKVGDPEAPVPLEALLDPEVRADFQAFKIWP
jgi:hypothetical protein